MRQTGRVLLLFSMLVLLLMGCSKKQEEEEVGYKIYYADMSGTRLQDKSYLPSAQTFDEIMDELAGQLADAPEGTESTLKNGVKLQGYQRGIDALRIDFSEEYYSLDNIEEVLLRAAVIKTFSQVPGVTKIMITVNDEQLTDSQGNLVPAMDGESFIDTREGGINSYQYATLSLYFVSGDGKSLVQEKRNLHYSSNMVLENVVTEQLIQGPDDVRLQPVFVNTAKILGVHVQDHTCTVDFDDSINLLPTESSAEPELALYALVNSICDTCDDIKEVRIRINGESSAEFRSRVSLEQVFQMDLSKVEEQFTEAETSQEKEVFGASDAELQQDNIPETEKISQDSGETVAETEQNSENESVSDGVQSVGGIPEAVGADDNGVSGGSADSGQNGQQPDNGSTQADQGKPGGQAVNGGFGSGQTIIGVDPSLAGE